MGHIRRITLVDQVVDELGRLIRESLASGDELPSIAELGEQFGVSRAVVREALKALEAQGKIDIVNGKRAKVVSESTRPLLRLLANALDVEAASSGEIEQLWHALEGDAAALAATHRTDTELDTLLDLVRQSASQTGTSDNFKELDARLHEEILCASHNRILRVLVHSLRDTLAESVDGRQPAKENLTEQVQLNAQLVSAILRRDPQAARRAMELRLLTAQPSDGSPPSKPVRAPRSVPTA